MLVNHNDNLDPHISYRVIRKARYYPKCVGIHTSVMRAMELTGVS